MSAQGELFPLDAASARAAGERGAQAAVQAAERRGFSTYAAIAFFWRFLGGAKGATPGEELVRAAKEAGLRPHDDRAFGAAFSLATARNCPLNAKKCRHLKCQPTAAASAVVVQTFLRRLCESMDKLFSDLRHASLTSTAKLALVYARFLAKNKYEHIRPQQATKEEFAVYFAETFDLTYSHAMRALNELDSHGLLPVSFYNSETEEQVNG